MAEKRYVVKLSSGGDGESYYNTGKDDGVPNAFAGSLFAAEGDAKCISKSKKGSVVCELAPKELKPPKPKSSIWPLVAIFISIAIVVRFPVFLGLIVPSSSEPIDCPPFAGASPDLLPEYCLAP